MQRPTEVSVTSDRGSHYEFKREPGINEAWHLSVSVHDPAGMDAVSIDIDLECGAPTIAHANFIDFFIERYASEFWASIEPFVRSSSEEMTLEVAHLKLIGVSVHLPAEIVSPVKWSIQYSYLDEGTHEFGLIIDFQDAEVLSAGLAD